MRCFSRDRLTHLAGRDTLTPTLTYMCMFSKWEWLATSFSIFPSFPTLYRVLVLEERCNQRKDVIRGRT